MTPTFRQPQPLQHASPYVIGDKLELADTREAAEAPVNTTRVQNDDDFEFWLLLGGAIIGVMIITSFIIILVVYVCRRKNGSKDNESIIIRKAIQRARYSSSENGGDSPPSITLPPSDMQLRGSLSSFPVQPKSRGHLQIQYQPGLLAVMPNDCYGTSDEEDAQVTNSSGKIWFSLGYKKDAHELTVHLVKIRYLKGRGMTHELRDPFVRLYLLPDEINYQESKVRKRTLAPKFNESFAFQLAPEDLTSRMLRFSVYDIDKRNVRHSLGHALIPLAKSEDASLQTVLWKTLEIVSQKSPQLGELQFSLFCNPYTERIKINIMRAKGLLFKLQDKEQAEMFCRVELYFGRKMVKVKETSPLKASECIEFFQNFSFCVAGRHFESSSMVVTIVLRKGIATKKDVAYGNVIVGPYMYARGNELVHWQEMVSNPRIAVEKWHNICEVTQLL